MPENTLEPDLVDFQLVLYNAQQLAIVNFSVNKNRFHMGVDVF
jgi:hypothetical protein